MMRRPPRPPLIPTPPPFSTKEHAQLNRLCLLFLAPLQELQHEASPDTTPTERLLHEDAAYFGGFDGSPRSAVSPAPIKEPDRKSTRLNSSHANISYAVFCLK